MPTGKRTFLPVALLLVGMMTIALTPAGAGGRREASPVPTAGGGVPESTTVQISDPWIRAVPRAGGSTGGYMEIGNPTAVDDRLLAASVAGVRVVELHTHIMEGGMARMRRVTDIPIPAGGTVRLAPGALHVMLMGVQEPLAAGTSVEILLRFERAGEIRVMATVR